MSILMPGIIALVMFGGASPHPQSTPQPLNWAADDEKRVAALAASGRRLEGTHVVVWVPTAIGEVEHRALVERLDRGVAALRDAVGSHEWQAVRQQKITYYISDDRFVSHGTGRAAVFIPLERAKDGRAPYLHEAMHELLATPDTRAGVEAERFERIKTRPLWLAEGLPDYVAQTVAVRTGVAEGDVFANGGLDGVDRTCASRLSGPAGRTILPFIGAPGRPDALFTTERQTVAPTFYACSFSFTKYIVDRVGLPATIALIPLIPTNTVHQKLEALTGKTMANLRSDWLRAIGHHP
jgi:hypothetical protein